MRRSVQSTTTPAPIKFGALATDTLQRIDHNDAVHSASAAHYTFETKMASLRRSYEEKAAEIRSEYLESIGGLNGVGEVD